MDINSKKRILSLVSAGLLTLASTSCGMIEMRDSNVDTEVGEYSADVMLAPAERYNYVETMSESMIETEEKAQEKKTIKVAVSGDIRIDDSIIKDAANRATEGKSYSFIRMFTGIYHSINNADISLGSFSTSDMPDGSENNTPVECIAALSELGYDVLDITDDDGAETKNQDYGAAYIDAASEENLNLREVDGVRFAFLAADIGAAPEYALSCSAEDLEYADFISDILVVSVNWDEGMTDADKRSAAEKLAADGADVIIGDGDLLGSVEWIDAGDGTDTLAVYSLGNLLCTSDEYQDLCGGLLEFEVTVEGGTIGISGVKLNPTVVYYTTGNSDYQIFALESFSDDLTASHVTSGVCYDNMYALVDGIVSDEYLSENLGR